MVDVDALEKRRVYWLFKIFHDDLEYARRMMLLCISVEDAIAHRYWLKGFLAQGVGNTPAEAHRIALGMYKGVAADEVRFFGEGDDPAQAYSAALEMWESWSRSVNG